MNRSRRWYLITGALLVGAVLTVALLADRLTPVSPHYWDARTSILEGSPPFPPEPGHPLGTDEHGRDLWTRLAYGARWSLFFALLIMAARLAVALPAAFAAAYGHRRVSWAIDKLYIFSSAIPPLLIYLLLLSPPQLRLIGLWPNVVLTVTVLTLVEWPRLAVTLKGRLQQLLTEPFMEGAVASGGTNRHIFAYHLLPHVWPTLLHLMAAEMARALLVIAQMGVFGIMVGGGVLNVVDNGRGGDRWVITTGVPEWGNLLADGRGYVLTKPWIPFAPAFAFLIAVVGFNLLSQGMEEATVSLGRLKAATTGRLSARWRWLWAVLPVAAVLVYCQGFPWGRHESILRLAAHQAERLTAGDTAGYLATISPGSATAMADYERWVRSLQGRELQAVSIAPVNLEIRGHRAKALWEIHLFFREGEPETVHREVELVRRWGRWYEQGEPYSPLRGYSVDVDAIYDPIDPAHTAVPLRWNVQYLATSLDHAYEDVSKVLGPEVPRERPLVRLYPSQGAFLAALDPGVPGDTTAYFAPGEPLRLSPQFLKGYKRWEIIRNLGFELAKYLSASRSGNGALDPLLLGRYERASAGDSAYRIDFYRMAGAPFMSLPELFATPAGALTQSRQWVYAAEAAVLLEFLEERLPPAELNGSAWSPAALASRLGLTEADLAARFDLYLHERLAGESVLTVPAARSRIPADLLEAVAAESRRRDHYETVFLDHDPSTNQVYVLEQVTPPGGNPVRAIAVQQWRYTNGDWWMASVQSPLAQP